MRRKLLEEVLNVIVGRGSADPERLAYIRSPLALGQQAKDLNLTFR